MNHPFVRILFAMPPAHPSPDVLTAAQARRLLLDRQGLMHDPSTTARLTPARLHRHIERIGFVQIDTISTVQRAHHHILHSRFDDYEPAQLRKLLDTDRKLFEHWTHDASIIPIAWFPQWKLRFERYRERGNAPNAWWRKRIGDNPDAVLDHVLERITDEGPLRSADFEHDRKDSGPWWGWKPQKAALEYLWRIGVLAVDRRVNFHKHYDLTERVLAHVYDHDPPGRKEHVDWACTTALERLGTATPAELAGFFNAIPLADARNWCAAARSEGRIVEVVIESADGSKPRRSYAFHDWKRRLSRVPDPPDRLRLLSPFDPVIRDRKRALRLFDFDYRFEAFTPASKRRYGYYVLPMLDRDRIVGRLDAKTHRDRSELEVKGLWWEPSVRVTKALRSRLDDALDRLANAVGVDFVVSEAH